MNERGEGKDERGEERVRDRLPANVQMHHVGNGLTDCSLWESTCDTKIKKMNNKI